jgi:type II secretory pathway component PulM
MNATAFGRLGAAWSALTQRIDALPDRERHALLLGAIAVLVAADWLFVQPLGTKRSVVLTAVTEQVDSAAAERANAEQAAAQARSELDAKATRLERELQQLGAERSGGELLARLLRRVLARHGVDIVALRDLEVVEIDATAAAASAPAATDRARVLFKHRLELTLSGDAHRLVAALAALDGDARPLRIERVRMLVAEGASTPQAVITLAVLGTERTWMQI